MKKMKLYLLFVSTLICFLSCEKNDDFCPQNDSYPNQIILKDLSISGDSIKLSWSKLDTLKFAGYLIIRKDSKDVIIDPTSYNINQYLVAKIHDPSITSYTDTNIPITPYLEYQIIGLLSNNYDYNYIFSNSKVYERPSIKAFDFNVLEIIPDLPNDRLIIIEKNQGKISILDYESLAVVKSVTTNATIGYCSIGNNGNTKELYVPRSDGWVFVYNAETLEKIDQIDMGHPSSCVVNKNGKLFISTDRWTKPLKVFDRTSKQKISESGDHGGARLRIIPNTNAEIIEVSINISPTDLDYFKFDVNGNFVLHKNDRYHGDYPLNADIFQFFPDGKKFITASEGAIYDIDLNYINRLPKGDLRFSDYAFDSNSSIIYCASSNSKKIVSYSNLSFNKIKEYKTQGYPFKIFRKDDTLICVSKTTTNSEYSSSSYKLIIEKIKL